MWKKGSVLISSALLILLTIIIIGCDRQGIILKHTSTSIACSLLKGVNTFCIPTDENPTFSISEGSKDYSESNCTKVSDYVNINDVRIPVLMFHSIKANGKNSLVIDPIEFEDKMRWLKENNYTTLSMEELHSMLTTGRHVPERPVVLTFDDGYEDNYTNAYPILKRYNFKATVFLITDNIGQSGFLRAHEIMEMFENNIDFQSHTAKHLELNLLSYINQLNEIKKSKVVIENLIHNDTNVLCYPVGKYNESTIRAAKDAGYIMCFTTKYGFSKSSDGLYTLTRIRMFPNIHLESILKC